VLGAAGVAALLATTLAAVLPAGPAGAIPAPPRAWVLVDADSGTVLSAANDHEAMPPASTAKLMTALVATEKLPPAGTIVVSQEAADQPAMKITMHAGERWPIGDAMRSLLIVSANDAAYALAEAASGTVQQFAKDADATARRLGMHDSTWRDPAGLDDEFAFNGTSEASAFDLAIAARNFLAVPELAAIAKLPEYRFTGPDGTPHVLRNHDRLLGRYEGAVGLKTGYTRKAGHTLVAAATRNGRTMIAVVLAADDSYGAAGALLDQGFATPADAPGTGEHLPNVAVTPTGTITGGHAPATPTFLPSKSAGVTLATHHGHSGLRRFIVVVAVLFVLLHLRRRQIRRRRARRYAHRPATYDEYATDTDDEIDLRTAPRRRTSASHDLDHEHDTERALEDLETDELPDFSWPTLPAKPAPIPVVDLSDLSVPEFDFEHDLEDELAARRLARMVRDRNLRRRQG